MYSHSSNVLITVHELNTVHKEKDSDISTLIKTPIQHSRLTGKALGQIKVTRSDLNGKTGF